MDYSAYLAGTPLFPLRALASYLIVFILLVTAVYLFMRHSHRPVRLKRMVLKTGLISLLLSAILAAYLLLPTAGISKTIITDRKIEIVFNRPVSRRMLTKKLEPDVPGVWVYEGALYGNHFLRKLVFYPDNPLPPGTSFKVTLSDVANTLRVSEPYTHEFSFQTQESPPVVVVEPKTAKKIAAHLYPTQDQSEVDINSPVKVVFESEVSKMMIESSFSISPRVGGKIIWENNTFVFAPVPSLKTNTKYTVSVLGASTQFTTTTPTFKLAVPFYLQQHALSCEVSALRMALAFRGIAVTEEDLLGQVGLDPTPHQGSTWGNPYQAFVGDVNGRQMRTGYGVYWGPIARVARNYRGAQEFEGWSISQLTKTVKEGNPIIVWTYSKSGAPSHWFTPSGEKIYAVAGEHTVVVVGFVGPADNPTKLIVNDSLIGQVYWSRSTFDKKWNVFNRSGVAIY